MKTTTLLLAAALLPLAGLNSCAPQAYPPGTPNPLDEPGASEATAEELHAGNLSEITGNPSTMYLK